MAVTICLLIMTALMATVTDAGFPKWRDQNDDFGFDNPMRYEYIRPLSLPSFPNFPLPQPPLLPWPSGFPKPNFGLPMFQQPGQTLSIPDIASQPAIPGSNFDGVVVSSQSSMSRGPDGKVQQTGGTIFVTSDNGKITVHKFGDNPPTEERTEYTNVPFGEFGQDPEFTHFKHSFKIPTFEPITMPPPIDLNYVPGPNEKFQASGYSVKYHSEDNNGVKTSGGEAEYLINDNGKIIKKKDYYGETPK